MTHDQGHYYNYSVAITYGNVSLWLQKSLENLGNVFPYLVATLYNEAERHSNHYVRLSF